MSTPVVAFFVLFFSVCFGSNEEFTCKEPKYSCGPIIPSLPRSYMAKMEVTNPIDSSTKYAVEYYDGEKLRGAITWLLEGEETRVLYDATAKTLFTIIGWDKDPLKSQAQCVVSPFIYQRDNFVIGLENNGGNNKFPEYFVLSGGILRYNPDLQFEYKDVPLIPTEVRGIKAKKWESCLHIPRIDGTFKIEFYWSDNSTSIPTPSGEDSVPLKTKVEGRFRPNPDIEAYKDISIVTQIIWFKSNPPMSDELFEPPRGVYCKNDNSTKPLPSLPNTFSVSIEKQMELPNTELQIRNQKVWFNLPGKLVRFDTFYPETDQDISEIHDYNSGLIYVTDVYGANCTSKIMPSDFPDPKTWLTMGADNLEFLGKHMIRDRLCETWSGTVNDSIVEISFLDQTWHQADKGGVLTRIPVQTTIITHTPIGAGRVTLNYFHFRPDEDEFPFEVNHCFSPDKRKAFQLSFQFNGDAKLFDTNAFARQCQIVLARECKVSALRISEIEAEFTENRIVVEFSILDQLATPSKNDVSLIDAVNNLNNVVTSNAVIVNAGPLQNSQEPWYLTALPDSLLEVDISDPCSHKVLSARFKRDTPSTAPTTQTDSSSVLDEWTTGSFLVGKNGASGLKTYGQLVGLGIGLFAVGAVLGVIVMLILLLRMDPRHRTPPRRDDGIQLTNTTQ